MLNKYKGCLIGLALGDALGAPVEFDSLETIKEHYGEIRENISFEYLRCQSQKRDRDLKEKSFQNVLSFGLI